MSRPHAYKSAQRREQEEVELWEESYKGVEEVGTWRFEPGALQLELWAWYPMGPRARAHPFPLSHGPLDLGMESAIRGSPKLSRVWAS